ncbi:MAG: OmpH family outer membrane protein [Bryobacteraceae bacterium]|nr:OmpH family outer membrane protein [Bryobacteraceae bacterium]
MRLIKFMPVTLALASALALQAQAPAAAKIGIVNIQQAIIGTKEGQAAAQALQAKFEPKRKELEGKQAEIQGKQTQLRNMSNAASDDQRRRLTQEIDQLQKSLQRSSEDAEAEFQQEQQRLLQDLGGRLMQALDKYSRDNAFTLILDVSSQQTPVLWFANGVDVTADLVALYDKNAPSTIGAPGAAKPPAAPPAAAPKKPVTPGAK